MKERIPLGLSSTGNCNFAYINNLRSFPQDRMEDVLKEYLTTGIRDTWGRPLPNNPDAKPIFQDPNVGMVLFAQGSDDAIENLPYSFWFRNYLEMQKLGTVWSSGPVPNKLHNARHGYLFVWIVDRTACRNWWDVNVYAPWLAEQEQKKAEVAEKAAKAAAKAITKGDMVL